MVRKLRAFKEGLENSEPGEFKNKEGKRATVPKSIRSKTAEKVGVVMKGVESGESPEVLRLRGRIQDIEGRVTVLDAMDGVDQLVFKSLIMPEIDKLNREISRLEAEIDNDGTERKLGRKEKAKSEMLEIAEIEIEKIEASARLLDYINSPEALRGVADFALEELGGVEVLKEKYIEKYLRGEAIPFTVSDRLKSYQGEISKKKLEDINKVENEVLRAKLLQSIDLMWSMVEEFKGALDAYFDSGDRSVAIVNIAVEEGVISSDDLDQIILITNSGHSPESIDKATGWVISGEKRYEDLRSRRRLTENEEVEVDKLKLVKRDVEDMIPKELVKTELDSMKKMAVELNAKIQKVAELLDEDNLGENYHERRRSHFETLFEEQSASAERDVVAFASIKDKIQEIYLRESEMTERYEYVLDFNFTDELFASLDADIETAQKYRGEFAQVTREFDELYSGRDKAYLGSLYSFEKNVRASVNRDLITELKDTRSALVAVKIRKAGRLSDGFKARKIQYTKALQVKINELSDLWANKLIFSSGKERQSVYDGIEEYSAAANDLSILIKNGVDDNPLALIRMRLQDHIVKLKSEASYNSVVIEMRKAELERRQKILDSVEGGLRTYLRMPWIKSETAELESLTTIIKGWEVENSKVTESINLSESYIRKTR